MDSVNPAPWKFWSSFSKVIFYEKKSKLESALKVVNSKEHLKMTIKSFQKKKGKEFNIIHKLMLLENTQFELKFEHISTL